MTHEPVMVREVLDVLGLRPGAVVVDGTLGLGGHSLRFLEEIGPTGVLVGFDWDGEMLTEAENRLREKAGNSLRLFHADYREMPELLKEAAISPDAILLDLGLNSAQIEDETRGIAFRTEGPLDMRMDRSRGEPASALLNRLSPDEIEKILWNNADERWARAIAREIVKRRKEKPLRTTADLVDAVLAAVPSGARTKHINPATKTFQAVRIAVNRELEGLQEAIEGIARLLAPDGVLAVLSYHSGEDRATKRAFRELEASHDFEDLFAKPKQPTPAEIQANPRSRSAKLRAVKRL
jgi:16S rRNA (cytosine1402-N4)-methyltransferase